MLSLFFYTQLSQTLCCSATGASNLMLAIASGVAIAAAANRTVLLPWGNLFEGNRFGATPPPGLHDWNLPSKVDPRCFLELSYRDRVRPCWAPFFDFYSAKAGNGTDLTQFMLPCKVVRIRSEQFSLPMALSFHVHGRALRDVLHDYGHAPMATLTAAMFRPKSTLVSAVEGFHHLQQEQQLTRMPNKSSTPRRPFLVTVHFRSVLLNTRFPNQATTTYPAFAKCASDWVISTNATHIYVACDNPAMVKTIEGMIRSNLPSHHIALSPVTFVTYVDFEIYALHRDFPPQSNSGHIKFADLAESLILGRGNVCIGTPGSTFSKVATNWWNAAFCEFIVEAGAPDQSCAVVGHHPWARAAKAPEHRFSQLVANDSKPALGDDAVGEGYMTGHVAKGVFGCDGVTCPNPPSVLPKNLRSSCAQKQGVRALRRGRGGPPPPPKCCDVSL